ncbi:hypothetical protein QBC38DRAFT_500777 [Podospora fimiseda]|uniref:Uncharacterized protein n=1 Tax=Podospora fimiseda TaxID=252190 RepID=A0AAN7H1U1_9PEZI|nr:hypothetical protein QBC38DRAFT_500777 [Podospora fimiseda]
MDDTHSTVQLKDDHIAYVFQNVWNRAKKRSPQTTQQRWKHAHKIYFTACWSRTASGIDIPQSVFEHPLIQQCLFITADFIWLVNAVVSYGKEKDNVEHNLVSVLKAQGISTQEAFDRIGEMIKIAVDNVSSELEELERNFDDIEAFLLTFPGDDNIRKASVSLITSILKAIENVIGYYMRNNISKAIKALVMQDDYQKPLSESLQEIKSHGQLLLKEAQKLNFWQNRQALETTEQNSAKLDQIVQLQQQQIADMQNSFKDLLEQLQHNRRLPNPQITAYLTANFNTIMSPPPPPAITQTDLHSLFNSQDPIDLQDTQTILNTQSRLVSSSKLNLDRILTSQKFNTWFVSPHSTKLLIHGTASHLIQYTSILSLFATTFLQTLRQSPQAGRNNIISLIFFCGLHLNQQDPHKGGRGILLSFLSQLLSQFDFPQIDTAMIDINALEQGDIHALLELFTSLTRQILYQREATIFCIIDGIKYYERDEFAHEMGVVVREILDLVRDQQEQAAEELQYREDGLGSDILKVLITSSAPTSIVRHAFDEEEILKVGMTEQG